MVLTESEYDKLYHAKKAAESQAVDAQLNYNLLQAQEAGTDSHPDYARALYQSQASAVKVDYLPLNSEKEVYEVTYNYTLWIYPNAAINPQGKDVRMQKTIKTGIHVRKGENGNLISTKL